MNKLCKKADKKLKKRTLKRRIFRVITLSNLIITIVLSISIFFASLMFIKGIISSMSYFISSNIATDISSPDFLRHMKIESLDELEENCLEFKLWEKSLERYQSISLNPNDEFHKKKFDKYKYDIDESESFRVFFANAKIKLDDEVIYNTKNILKGRNAKLFSLERINFFDKWLETIISHTTVSVPITDNDGNEIGEVTTELASNLIATIIIVLIILTIFISLIALLISRLLVRFFAIPVLKPLKQLQNRMDEIVNSDITDNCDKPVDFKKPLYEIAMLADSTNKIISKRNEYTQLLSEQNDELEAQKDELESQKTELETVTSELKRMNLNLERKNIQLENIFNNVGQGFLTFDKDLLIRDEYSLECERIFNKEIKNLYFPKLVFSEDDEQVEFLDSILKKILSEDDDQRVQLYLPLLPKEIEINGKSIYIEYKVVKDITAQTGKSFMLILTDITEKKALEEQRDRERRVLKMVVKIISNQDEFLELVNAYTDFYRSKLFSIIERDMLDNEKYSEIFRQIHTFKGSFSQFDMLSTVKKIHDIETKLTEEKDKHTHLDKNVLKKILSSIDFEDVLYEEIKILKKYLGDRFLEQKNIVKIEKQRIVEIEEKMLELLPNYECNVLLPDVRRLRYRPIKEMLKGYIEYVVKLSDRQEKQINPSYIKGDNPLIDSDYYKDFFKSLIHVFRNIIDHGIEDVEDRALKGKSEIGNISCSIENTEDVIKITISDDGRGIDLDKVRQKLKDLQIYTSDKIDSLSKKDLLSEIFREEFSTAESVTEISGRGVGLSAVKHEVEKLDGDIEIVTDKDKGTSFIFTIPVKAENEIVSVNISTIMNALTQKTKKYIKNYVGKSLALDDKDYKITDKIHLNKVTSLINVRGGFNAIFALSVNEKLTRELVRGFIIDDISPKEETSMMEDVVSESSNIILGNSISIFDEFKNIVNVGSPTILCNEGAWIKNTGTRIITTNLKNGDYELSISIISMDNNLVDKEDN